jgi:hypothetical protein
MHRIIVTAVACIVLSGIGGGIASAKNCRDASGKFVKCPPAATKTSKQCRDAKGKFIKCAPKKM